MREAKLVMGRMAPSHCWGPGSVGWGPDDRICGPDARSKRGRAPLNQTLHIHISYYFSISTSRCHFNA